MEEQLKKITYEIKKINGNNNGATYDILVKVPTSIGWIERMKFITETSYERKAYQLHYIKDENDFVYFKEAVTLSTKALYHYYFSFEANHNFIYLKKSNIENYKSVSRDDMWKLSVNFEVPKWAQGGIMYHIFVDRFNKGRKEKLQEMPNRIIHNSWDEDIIIGPNQNGLWNTDFYGGDLEGIIEKLDYIKSLGVNILYLSPIVLSQSNHRYDTADYEMVDPYAGDLIDLERLCQKAHEKGIKVILDAVFNHTGNDSKYFNEFHTFPNLGAYESDKSLYFPFYRKYFDNSHICFDYWWGMKNLPVCDGHNKEWQEYIYGVGGVIDLWFSKGIDGLRLDVADELTDEFIEGIREAVHRNKKDGLVIGEVWKNPMQMQRGYLESGKGMDTVMNYQLINALIRYFKYGDYHLLNRVIKEIQVEYPDDTINSLMNFTSTHDITRAINIFACNDFNYYGEWAWNLSNQNRDFEKNYHLSQEQYDLGKKVYLAYLYTLTFFPGMISIFYGDEVGLQGMGNLANRRPFSWHRMDHELLQYFQKIGQIRQKELYLHDASLDIVDINDKYLSFLRKGINDEALIYVNRLNEKVDIKVPKTYQYEKVLYSLNNSTNKELNNYGGIVLKKTRK